jgi:hypothetical protein
VIAGVAVPWVAVARVTVMAGVTVRRVDLGRVTARILSVGSGERR